MQEQASDRPPSEVVSAERTWSLFASFLRTHFPASAAEFERFLDAHADAAADLRAMYAAYTEVEAHVPGPLARDDRAAPSALMANRLWQQLLATGSRGDRYELRGEIAKGGMGVVHHVWDDELRRPLALKVMRDGLGSEARRLRFLNEAQVTAQLDHPGIVPVHEIGMRTGAGVYYTMRLIEGADLSEVFRHVTAGTDGWTQLRGIDVLRRVCDAVRYAHDHGVVHRDLKPANVRVGRYGEVYVMDWGLARSASAQGEGHVHLQTEGSERKSSSPESPVVTNAGDVLGTPSYMAPEQALGRHDLVDARTDVYAIGAILYHLVCGRPPFLTTGDQDAAAVLQQLQGSGPTPDLRAAAPACAPELAAICAKAMARDLAHRYQSVVELAADLRAYAEGRVVRAYEWGPIAELRKWIGRNQALSAVGIVALVAVVVGLTIGPLLLSRWVDERERRDVVRLLQDLNEFQRQSSDPPLSAEGSTREWWLHRAGELVRGGDRSLGLATYERRLLSLQERATGSDPDRIVLLYKRIPLRAILDSKREELAWRERLSNLRPWLSPAEVADQLRILGVPDTVRDRNRMAFGLVNPDRGRRYGWEQCAVDIAEKAVAGARGDHELFPCLDTLAFAYYRCGRYEEALLAHAQARGHLHAYAVKGDPKGPVPIEEWQRSIENNGRALRRMIEHRRNDHEGALVRATLVQEIESLEWEYRARTLTFADVFDEWWHGQLFEVVARLKRLSARIAQAEAAGGDGQAWQHAIDAIAADARYGHRRITAQLDLLPLGPDLSSRLQEFAHLPSGLPPQRENGHLAITADSCLVFVLVPGVDGGTPYFLSKYEVTRNQWARLEGAWPVAELEVRSICPQLDVSWSQCVDKLRAMGSWLRLPSLAEWNNACSAGDWLNRATIADLLPAGTSRDAAVDDQRPNSFGLHNMVGGADEPLADDVLEDNRFQFPRLIMARPLSWLGDLGAPRAERLAGDVVDADSTVSEGGLRPARSLLP